MPVPYPIIDDVLPWTQAIAGASQFIYSTTWTANVASDIQVYSRLPNVPANDALQAVSSDDYTVEFIGDENIVQVTFLPGLNPPQNNIVTIMRNTPTDRMNLYSNTIFTPSMLNSDFGTQILTTQQNQLYNQQITPRYNNSATVVVQDPITGVGGDQILPILGALQGWVKDSNNDEIIAYDFPDGGGLAPNSAEYVLQTANADLDNAVALDEFASGFMVNTLGTGFTATRIITPVSRQTTVANGNGVSGNPVIGISDNALFPGTAGVGIPEGSTAERPASPLDTSFRFNSTIQNLEYWDGSSWVQLSEVDGVVSVSGTVNQIDVDNTDPQNPMLSLSETIDTPGTFTIQSSVVVDEIINDDTMATATGSNIGTALSIKTYIDDLIAGTVFTVAGTGNEIDVDSTDPQNLILSLADNAILPGTGGFTLPMGTTAQRAGAAGTMRFNSQTSVFESTVDGVAWATIDTSTSGDVDSIIGTANQVLANGTSGISQAGNVTLTLPQNINTTATPIFAGFNDSNGIPELRFTTTASANNYFNIQNAIGAPVLSIAGLSTNAGMTFAVKGLAAFSFQTEASANIININSGTGLQHTTAFSFANTAATQFVTFPDATGTLLMTGVAINSVPSISFGGTALDNYTENNWTPIDASGAGLVFTTSIGRYTRVGRMVVASCQVTYPVTASGLTALIGGLPFLCANNTGSLGGVVMYSNASSLRYCLNAVSSTIFQLFNSIGSQITNTAMSGSVSYFQLTYFV